MNAALDLDLMRAVIRMCFCFKACACTFENLGDGDVGLEDLLGDDDAQCGVEVGAAAGEQGGLARAGAPANTMEVRAATAAARRDKPRVERTVPFVRQAFFAGETCIDLPDAQRRA